MIRILKTFVYYCLVYICATTLVVSSVYAQESESFDTQLTSTYTVDAVGVTKVSHTFKITNTQPTIFLTQYALKTSYPNLQNVVVRYNSDILLPSVVQDDQGTTIAIEFPDEVVGEGKTRTFSIEYVNTNISQLAGSVLEMHIPELPDAANYSVHKTVIQVPEQFGYPSRITPQPEVVETTNGRFILNYQDQKGAAITALFGDTQLYKLTLRYELENATSGTALAQIALPPDTAFQKMHYYDIDPQPESLKTDTDGNWIATYQIPPTSATNVYVTAATRVTLTPNTTVPITTPTSKMSQRAEYWDTSAALIQDLARQYKTPQSIYDYVVKTLSYSTENISEEGSTRLGAVKALENPTTAVCQEFTDTFITLARAAAIPARRNVGYGYSEDNTFRPSSFQGDILHAWPEYWDTEKQLWIPVDPTWGNTTGGIDYFSHFDLNHIVFAINGESSTTPYPAGSYKSAKNENTQDVEITFATEFPEISPAIDVSIEPKRVFGIPLPGIMTAHIINKTGQAWYNVSLGFATEDTHSTITPTHTKLQSLLPYERESITVTAFQNSLALPKKVIATPQFVLMGDTVHYSAQPVSMSAGPQIVKYVTDQTIIITLAGSSIVLALIAGSLLVFRQRR